MPFMQYVIFSGAAGDFSWMPRTCAVQIKFKGTNDTTTKIGKWINVRWHNDSYGTDSQILLVFMFITNIQVKMKIFMLFLLESSI